MSLYSLKHLGIGDLPNRLKKYSSIDDIVNCLNLLKPVFNLKASKANEYGIVYHPK